ncbi:MAG: DUF3253 domain-containing protein [Verrucomicrobiota bacterium]
MPDDLEAAILERLSRLKPEGTMCPGQLAKILGSTQKELRPLYVQLAREGRVVISQGGVRVRDFESLRGAYRVRLPGQEDDA